MSNSQYDHIIPVDHYLWETFYHFLLKPPTIKNQLRRRSTMWVYHVVSRMAFLIRVILGKSILSFPIIIYQYYYGQTIFCSLN